MAETIKEAIASLILRWDGDALDYESERRAIIEVTNGIGELELPRGPQGEKGLDGEMGPGFSIDAVIDYPTDLEAQTHLPTGLGPLDRGYWVLNDATNTGLGAIDAVLPGTFRGDHVAVLVLPRGLA